ncbi:hypothetical protein ACFX13_003043 [Malus domestica]
MEGLLEEPKWKWVSAKVVHLSSSMSLSTAEGLGKLRGESDDNESRDRTQCYSGFSGIRNEQMMRFLVSECRRWWRHEQREDVTSF